ncbi:MAG: hypothetical protein ACI85O_000141 [Saprospiraceae bacterium]|jgi:hypothetical protein
MIALLIKSSIVIAVLLAFYKLFLEKKSFFKNNRIYLFAGLLFAFILPFITLPQMVSEQGIISEMIEKMSSEEKPEEVFVETQIPELTEESTTQISPLTRK